MAEGARPPVAIRIVRPYETEEQLFENELETIGKTSVLLIGAHPRPTGVILRFEVTLASGATVLRGEGRVLAHKENAFRGLAGLSLRFTRLDPRSKAVVDRATALREARGQSATSAAGAPSRPPARPDPAIADALTAGTPAPPQPQPKAQPEPPPSAPRRPSTRPTRQMQAVSVPSQAQPPPLDGLTPPPAPVAVREELAPTPVPTPITSVPGEVEEKPVAPPADAPDVATLAPNAPPTIGAPPLAPTVSAPPIRAPRARNGGARAVEPPQNRAELLARLRDRIGKLPPERFAEIRSRKAEK
ncbi:MAG: hypothetical protein KF819_29690 [Labilithrix sp.]|nr:hypothetical protein [Labilithrix sp.]